MIEVLDEGDNVKELKYKYNIYEQAGVKEYWIVMPSVQYLTVYTLQDEKFVPSRPFVSGDVLISSVLPGFTMDMNILFSSKQDDEDI